MHIYLFFLGEGRTEEEEMAGKMENFPCNCCVCVCAAIMEAEAGRAGSRKASVDEMMKEAQHEIKSNHIRG